MQWRPAGAGPPVPLAALTVKAATGLQLSEAVGALGRKHSTFGSQFPTGPRQPAK